MSLPVEGGSLATVDGHVPPRVGRVSRRRWWPRLSSAARLPVSGVSLAVVRVALGMVAVLTSLRTLIYGWADTLYSRPVNRFTYYGLGWVPHPGPTGVQFLLLAVAAAGIGLVVGRHTRWWAAVLLGSFGWIETIDATTYLNHYWFVTLLALLAVVSPLDGSRPVAVGWIWLFRFQIGVVYAFAGLAKLHPDWLFEALPLRLWLPARADFPVVGHLLTVPVTAHLLAVAGALFDCFVVPGLLWRRTRPFAWAALVTFHVSTWLLFPIGVFPWLMIGVSTVFWSPDWPSRLLQAVSRQLFPRHLPPRQVISRQLSPHHLSPHHLFPHHLFPRQVVSRHLFPRQVVSRQLFPRHLFPRHLFPRQVLPGQVVSRQLFPGQVVSDRVSLDRALSDRLVSEQCAPEQCASVQVVPGQARVTEETGQAVPGQVVPGRAKETEGTGATPLHDDRSASRSTATSPATTARLTTPPTTADTITRMASSPTAARGLARLAPVAVGLWVVVQLALPLRHLAYPGDHRWTGEGYRFGWNVLLIDRTGSVTFVVTEPSTDRTWTADLGTLYSENQIRVMSGEPDLILQAAHAIRRTEALQGRHVEVRADAWLSFNGRPAERWIDPTVDLAAEPSSLRAKRWILQPD